MKKTYNSISFSDRDTGMGSRIKLLPILLVILLIAALGAGGYFGYKFINARRNAVVSIEVTSLPTKYIYWVGQDINYTGLEITATRKNGKTFVVAFSDCNLSGYKNDVPMESRVIRVDYQNCTTFFSVEVREKPTATPVLKGISIITMPKTEYKAGDRLDATDGVILIEYTNALPERVNIINDMVTGYSKDCGPGIYELTVTYTDRELNQTATTTYTITVTE